ncbi:hypothetical protein T11_11850 [Trichinella zimbabwensis]|uniref:Retroviral polymerase SH3-like domain-containing protein n=1 Tax=Trichinella zimbabwensis TaxID=268475 RepID=A0A0V1GWC3_9BILA|nr:hypothetical protein T11_11850 [Trichinella zimbabwensis]
MPHATNLVKSHGAEAEHAAAYFVNHVVKEIQTSMIPSDAYKHAPKQHQEEFGKKSRKDIFIGYPTIYKIFRVFEPRKYRTDESQEHLVVKDASDDELAHSKDRDNLLEAKTRKSHMSTVDGTSHKNNGDALMATSSRSRKR